MAAVQFFPFLAWKCEFCDAPVGKQFRGKDSGVLIYACNEDHAKKGVAKRRLMPDNSGKFTLEREKARNAIYIADAKAEKARTDVIDHVTKMNSALLDFLDAAYAAKEKKRTYQQPRLLDYVNSIHGPLSEFEVDLKLEKLPENEHLQGFERVGDETAHAKALIELAIVLYQRSVVLIEALRARTESLLAWRAVKFAHKELFERRDFIRRNPTIWEEAMDDGSLVSVIPRDIVNLVSRYHTKQEEKDRGLSSFSFASLPSTAHSTSTRTSDATRPSFSFPHFTHTAHSTPTRTSDATRPSFPSASHPSTTTPSDAPRPSFSFPPSSVQFLSPR